MRKPESKSDSFIKKQLAIIEAHKQLLIKSGHMESEFGMAHTILGRYAWHGNGNGYFGAYSFYEPAFKQAQRAWFLHGNVLEGSNELWPEDDWDSANQRHIIHFDNSIIGYQIPGMAMFWYEGDKHQTAWFTAKVIGIKDEGHTLVLDKRAPHHAEQWGMKIVPPDWIDLCECTNNFSPPFQDGSPVLEQ